MRRRVIMSLSSAVQSDRVAELNESGYTVFPGVFSQDEIARMRSFLEKKLDDRTEQMAQGNSSLALLDIYSRYRETRWILYHEGMNAILRRLLDVSMPVNLRAATLLHQKSAYWHNETMDFEDVGYDFHRKPGCIMLQTVIYLQDNVGEYGAALEVDGGSHHLPDPFIPLATARDYRAKNSRSPETRCGDLLIFDWRLAHKATPGNEGLPGVGRKLGIFSSYTNEVKYAKL